MANKRIPYLADGINNLISCRWLSGERERDREREREREREIQFLAISYNMLIASSVPQRLPYTTSTPVLVLWESVEYLIIATASTSILTGIVLVRAPSMD